MAAHGEAIEKDRGALIRVTPLDGIGSEGGGLRHRVDLAAGFAQLNYDDSEIIYIDEDQPDPIVEDRRLGFSARWKLALRAGRGWIWSLVSPTVDIGFAWQQSKFYDGGSQVGGTITRRGQELVLADVVSLRHGYVDDEVGTVENDTWGVGAGLAYRKAIGARFDWAQVPQSRFLRQDVQRRSITVYVDPLKIWRELR